jgi:predicted RNA-binding Zn-ribbon protein involved in translation (DUF1610 family)
MADESDPVGQDLLLAFLKDRDVTCPLCQYNLRNLTIFTCPECGKRIELAVKARDVAVQSWATLSVVLSLAAGVGIIFLYMVIRRGLPNRGDVNPILIYTFIGMIPLAIAALVARQKILRMSRDAQFYLAALAVGSVAVLFFFLLGTIR